MPRPASNASTQRQRPPEPPRPLWERLAWLAGIWLASVTVLGIIAWILRLWLAP